MIEPSARRARAWAEVEDWLRAHPRFTGAEFHAWRNRDWDRQKVFEAMKRAGAVVNLSGRRGKRTVYERRFALDYRRVTR